MRVIWVGFTSKCSNAIFLGNSGSHAIFCWPAVRLPLPSQTPVVLQVWPLWQIFFPHKQGEFAGKTSPEEGHSSAEEI